MPPGVVGSVMRAQNSWYPRKAIVYLTVKNRRIVQTPQTRQTIICAVHRRFLRCHHRNTQNKRHYLPARQCLFTVTARQIQQRQRAAQRLSFRMLAQAGMAFRRGQPASKLLRQIERSPLLQGPLPCRTCLDFLQPLLSSRHIVQFTA